MSSLSGKSFERLISPRPPKVQKEEINVSTGDPGEELSTGTFHEVHRTDKESPSTLTGFSVIAKPKGNRSPAASVSSAHGGATRFSSRIRKKISSQKDTYTSVARHQPDENNTIEPDDEEPLDLDDNEAITDIEMAECWNCSLGDHSLETP
ncbi:unnamed protein product [Cylindrotheca closterium]|uniref:Uncharacterized protein n=1 Tax=Cylindrotheca closterium TaxID=2856 RepID=A0AAD2PWT1_9STRA|nr:unnamed protein product [Cylindrotheca closterium]